jgi:hypothetical protein
MKSIYSHKQMSLVLLFDTCIFSDRLTDCVLIISATSPQRSADLFQIKTAQFEETFF